MGDWQKVQCEKILKKYLTDISDYMITYDRSNKRIVLSYEYIFRLLEKIQNENKK